jgi:transglutaminase-like putative cysteine protease
MRENAAACASADDIFIAASRQRQRNIMYIKVGYELVYDCPQPTPTLLMLNIHFSHANQIVTPDVLTVSPSAAVSSYRDGFGNWCSRLEMPAGRTTISTSAVVRATGLAEPTPLLGARQHLIGELPEDALVFLLASRYCETEMLGDIAWKLFSNTPLGWARVQAICDFVHNHIKFDYMQARATRTAFEAYNERTGVCRDFAHLAIALCRCMNIPARYCTGYLGDIGMPPPYGPMDFAGSIRATTCPASAGCSSPAGAMPWMSPSAQPSVPTRSPASP